jgi:hypothetical protein
MEKGIDGLFSFHLGHAGSIGYTVNNIKFDHGFGPPSAYLCEIGLLLWRCFSVDAMIESRPETVKHIPLKGRKSSRLTKRNGARDDGRQKQDDHAPGQAQLIS